MCKLCDKMALKQLRWFSKHTLLLWGERYFDTHASKKRSKFSRIKQLNVKPKWGDMYLETQMKSHPYAKTKRSIV